MGVCCPETTSCLGARRSGLLIIKAKINKDKTTMFRNHVHAPISDAYTELRQCGQLVDRYWLQISTTKQNKQQQKQNK